MWTGPAFQVRVFRFLIFAIKSTNSVGSSQWPERLDGASIVRWLIGARIESSSPSKSRSFHRLLNLYVLRRLRMVLTASQRHLLVRFKDTPVRGEVPIACDDARTSVIKQEELVRSAFNVGHSWN